MSDGPFKFTQEDQNAYRLVVDATSIQAVNLGPSDVVLDFTTEEAIQLYEQLELLREYVAEMRSVERNHRRAKAVGLIDAAGGLPDHARYEEALHLLAEKVIGGDITSAEEEAAAVVELYEKIHTAAP